MRLRNNIELRGTVGGITHLLVVYMYLLVQPLPFPICCQLLGSRMVVAAEQHQMLVSHVILIDDSGNFQSGNGPTGVTGCAMSSSR